MAKYSNESKANVVKKFMPPNNQNVTSICKVLNLNPATVYRWKVEYQKNDFVVPKKASEAED